jgi:hypothetical protein
MDWCWQLAAYRNVVPLRVWERRLKADGAVRGNHAHARFDGAKFPGPERAAGLPKNWAGLRCHAI